MTHSPSPPPADSQADLIRHIQALAPKHPLRKRLLTQLISQMQTSGKIWRGDGCDREAYDDALQDAWVWFCKNIDQYDPDRSDAASPIHWFNATLKWRIHDQIKKKRDWDLTKVSLSPPDDGSDKPTFDIAAGPDGLQSLKQLETWLQGNEDNFRKLHVRGNPKANAYDLIWHRVIHETKWEQLDKQMGSPVPTLSNFFQTKCIPLLWKFLDDLP